MHFHSQGKQAIDCSVSATPRKGSDQTWNTSHGITFASNHESTSLLRAFQPLHGIPSEGKSSQKDLWLWTESQTPQHTRPREEHCEGFGDVAPTKTQTHPLNTQITYETKSPSLKSDGHSPESAHSKGCSPPNDEAFRSPLGFHIPQAKLRNALLAEPTSSASYWHYTLYQGPGGDKDKVKVHYCKNKEITEKIAQLFLNEKIIGFDIEWKPNSCATDGITKNVALIQLASEERVLLAHIARYPNAATSEKEKKFEDFVAPSLKQIMYGLSQCYAVQFVPFDEAQDMFRQCYLYLAFDNSPKLSPVTPIAC